MRWNQENLGDLRKLEAQAEEALNEAQSLIQALRQHAADLLPVEMQRFHSFPCFWSMVKACESRNFAPSCLFRSTCRLLAQDPPVQGGHLLRERLRFLCLERLSSWAARTSWRTQRSGCSAIGA